MAKRSNRKKLQIDETSSEDQIVQNKIVCEDSNDIAENLETIELKDSIIDPRKDISIAEETPITDVKRRALNPKERKKWEIN